MPTCSTTASIVSSKTNFCNSLLLNLSPKNVFHVLTLFRKMEVAEIINTLFITLRNYKSVTN